MHKQVTLIEIENQLLRRMEDLKRQLNTVRNLKKEFSTNDNISRYFIKKELPKRHRKHGKDATPRIMSVIAHSTFPISIKKLRRETNLPGSTIGSFFSRKVKERYFKKIGRGLYDKDEHFTSVQ